ncbi:hypothetical protein QL285_077810 [Trifolium repens]|nr:hypothetical protein QL285_077810 [Trifolium repens]
MTLSDDDMEWKILIFNKLSFLQGSYVNNSTVISLIKSFRSACFWRSSIYQIITSHMVTSCGANDNR